jgi:hypothetical protein
MEVDTDLAPIDRNRPNGYGEFTLSLKPAGSWMCHSVCMVAPDGCSEDDGEARKFWPESAARIQAKIA